jgi:fucose 4-O-acetylase-like acetyltransferase
MFNMPYGMIKNEKNFIDVLKGFLIILVVFGHLLQTYYVDFDQLFLFKLIYSFHMPFFMLISGYLANMSLQKNGCSVEKCITKKFIYLIIPFVSWYIIDLILQGNFVFSDLFHSLSFLLTHVDSGLWYLYILFVLYILLYFADKLKYKYGVLWVLFVALPMTNILGVNLLKWYLIFFIIGMFTFDYQIQIEKIMSNYFANFIYLVPAIFLISLYYWEREFTQNSIFSSHVYLYGYKFIVAIFGIITILLLTKKIYKLTTPRAIFDNFGKNSLKIYILNFIAIGLLHEYIKNDNQLLLVVLALLICYFIVWITSLAKDFKIVQILFGEFSRNKN